MAMVPPNPESKEAIALALLHIIADVEDKALFGSHSGQPIADRAYILDTYSECLVAAAGQRFKKG